MLTLQGYLTNGILSRITKKGFFSGRYIFFDEYISNAAYAFETSSVIGYTFRNQLASLVELMAKEGGGETLFKAIGTFPETRLTKQKAKPKNFFDFFFKSELIHILEIMQKPNLIKECESGDYRNSFKLKVPYEFAFTHMQMIIAEGVGFGSKYPVLTENFLSYEHDKEEWSLAFKAGLNITENPPETIPMPKRQEEVKDMITPFIAEFRPDLLTSLQLTEAST